MIDKSMNHALPNKKRYPPGHRLKFNLIDIHTAGQRRQRIIEGFPDLQGDTISARRQTKEKPDHLCTALSGNRAAMQQGTGSLPWQDWLPSMLRLTGKPFNMFIANDLIKNGFILY